MQYDDVSEYGGRAVGAIILVYSITSQQSFEFVASQLRDIRDAADQTPVVVVANKTDLVRTRHVSEDGQTLCRSHASRITLHCTAVQKFGFNAPIESDVTASSS